MLTLDKELFEYTKNLVDETYLNLVIRHTKANLNGSDLPMEDLDELLCYVFLFSEVDYETYVNEEGYNNILLNHNVQAIRDRVSELNKPNNLQNF